MAFQERVSYILKGIYNGVKTSGTLLQSSKQEAAHCKRVITHQNPVNLHLSGDQHIMQEQPLLSGSSSNFLGAYPYIVKQITFSQEPQQVTHWKMKNLT